MLTLPLASGLTFSVKPLKFKYMKHPKLPLAALLVGSLTLGISLAANTPLLTNTGFVGTEPWRAGSNLFTGTNWTAFVGSHDARYTVESRIQRSGNSVIFSAYDDGVSDIIESFLFQEFNAGPLTSPWPTVFSAGDVIVFNGTASATQTGTNTVVRAFIKTLGYNSMGWEFQTKGEYSDFVNIGPNSQDFSLSITYPDLAVDDSLQVIQIGFEITTRFAGGTMGTGTITFSNLEAFVVGDEQPTPTWLGYPIDENGWANTGDFMGYVYAAAAPWVWNLNLQSWMFIPAEEAGEFGEWVFIVR